MHAKQALIDLVSGYSVFTKLYLVQNEVIETSPMMEETFIEILI